MNPNLATLLSRDPRIFDPLPVIIECEHMLIDSPKGPVFDGRTVGTPRAAVSVGAEHETHYDHT